MHRHRYRNVLYDCEAEYANGPFIICLTVAWMEAHHLHLVDVGLQV